MPEYFRINLFLLVMVYCLTAAMVVQAADDIETAGDVLAVALPVVSASFTLGFKDGQGAVQFGESTALSLGVTYGLKFTIDAKRPNGGNKSFPSTHASISFTSAEFMRKHYGWEYGIPAYAVATFVAYSRVESNQHYNRDVIAGAVIGIGSSYLFTQPYEGWQIQPHVNHSFYGIRFSYKW